MEKNPDSLGLPLAPPVAMAGRPDFSGVPEQAYLSDAGCRPNPGSHLPVVWDGNSFLDTYPVTGTNHRAVYQAVQTALKAAATEKITHVELRLTSDLVYRQLSTGGYCRNPGLGVLRDSVFYDVERVAPVRLVLVTEPFTLGGQNFKTRKQLRDHVLALRLDAKK